MKAGSFRHPVFPALVLIMAIFPGCLIFEKTTVRHETTAFDAVLIDGKWWMTHNLESKTFQNGESIHQIRSMSGARRERTVWRPGYAKPRNKGSESSSHGLLYNWGAIHDGRGICPEGWHVPSRTEWCDMMSSTVGGIGRERDQYFSGALKSVEFWGPYNGDNKSGLNVIPSEAWFPLFNNKKQGSAYFWTSSTAPGYHQFYCVVFNPTSHSVEISTAGPENMLSCRCVKD